MRKLIVLLVFSLLAACAPAPVTPQSSATPLATASAPATPSASPLPPSATFTASPAPTASPTPPPTPLAQFAAFEILSIENMQVGGVRITLRLPGIGVPLTLGLDARVYDCKTDSSAPDRLFCNGLAMPPLDQQVTAMLTDPANGQTAWTAQTVVRANLVTFPVRRTYFARPECSELGKNLGCETECRINTNGLPCIVSTCFDVCGAYFSVHTCDPEMNKPFTMCAPEVTEQMKVIYGVP